MAQRLTDLRPGANALGEGVSLVTRGANGRRFLFAKSDELDADIAAVLEAPVAKEAALLNAVRDSGGDESVEKAAAAAARSVTALEEAYADASPEQRAAIRKAMSDLLDNEDEDDDEDGEDEDGDVEKSYQDFAKAKYNAEQLRQMAKNGQALPDESYPIADREDLEHAIHAVGRGKNNSHATIRAHIVKRAKALGATSMLPDSYGDVTKGETMPETATVPIKKDDGTWDLSGVPEDQRPAFEQILKAQDDEIAELRKAKEAEETKAEEALKIAKAEQEQRVTREFVAKSETLANLAKDDTELGTMLRDISKAEQDGNLPESTFEKLETLLKAADEQIGKGDLFREIGRAGNAATGDAQAKLDAAAADLRKSNPTMTKAQAVAKALENDPSLYSEIRKEQG